MVSVAARMWGRAQLLVLLTVLCAHGDDAQDDSELKVGRAIDIFTRYGYLSLSVKVVPRNESSWIFREPTIEVFVDLDRYAVERRMPKRQRQVFEGNFHMEFCENANQLLQAYFRDFSFEGVEKPWKAFSGSWAPETVARNLGINSSFILSDLYGYVLVRLSRHRESVELSRIPNNVNLADAVAQEIDGIRVGDVSSVIMFIKKYGSHFIHSFVTGNSIYQVFVYTKNHYHQIKDRLKTRGVSHINKVDLIQYFGPAYSVHLGKIKVASGNKTVEKWVENKLRFSYYLYTYQSLLKVHGDSGLLSTLNNLLRNEAVVELNMKNLAPAFKDPVKRAWFEEVLNNFIKLWEVNL
ncbi:torso-like protein isoform X2 [Aethina tumida]|uniref:torso-like protein isoform X2 n=1 Tax=Aethina tumida TaxID=116153 RepID=UPI0021485D0B|nr:torso-like protein isoform X2 [Aethina tumida]